MRSCTSEIPSSNLTLASKVAVWWIYYLPVHSPHVDKQGLFIILSLLFLFTVCCMAFCFHCFVCILHDYCFVLLPVLFSLLIYTHTILRLWSRKNGENAQPIPFFHCVLSLACIFPHNTIEEACDSYLTCTLLIYQPQTECTILFKVTLLDYRVYKGKYITSCLLVS